jgi:hypothetical protein
MLMVSVIPREGLSAAGRAALALSNLPRAIRLGRGPVPTPCEIVIRSYYGDGSIVSGFCIFVYTNQDGQIADFAEVEAAEATPGDGLRFRQSEPGRVGAYHVHLITKKTDGSEKHSCSYRWATPGEHIETDQLRVPKLDVNSASHKELLSLVGIGPKRSNDLIAARPFKTEQDVASVLGDNVFEAIKPSIELA